MRLCPCGAHRGKFYANSPITEALQDPDGGLNKGSHCVRDSPRKDMSALQQENGV